MVFGAAGRLGRCVAAEALSRDHRVIGVVRGVPSLPVGEDVEVVTGDVTDLGAVRRLARSADVLVATVGVRTSPYTSRPPAPLWLPSGS